MTWQARVRFDGNGFVATAEETPAPGNVVYHI